MSEILFYHLTQARWEEMLPALIDRAYQRQWRAAVYCPHEEICGYLDGLLWSFTDNSFLPHGTRADPYPGEQPILLSTDEENRNQAYVCFCIAGAIAKNPAAYQRLCLLFDGNNAAELAAARLAWKQWQAEKQGDEKRYNLTYWQQTPQRKWERKA